MALEVDALGGDEYDLVLAERLPLVAGTHYALAVASASTGSPYAESIALPAVACSGGISYTRSFSGAGLSPPASLASLGTSTSELMGGSLTICPSCPIPQLPVGGSVSITSSVAGGGVTTSLGKGTVASGRASVAGAGASRAAVAGSGAAASRSAVAGRGAAAVSTRRPQSAVAAA